MLNLESTNLRFGWHVYLFYDKERVNLDFNNHILRYPLLKVWKKYKKRISTEIPLWTSPPKAFFKFNIMEERNWLLYEDLVQMGSSGYEILPQEKLIEKNRNITWFFYRQLRERLIMDKRQVGISRPDSDLGREIMSNKKSPLLQMYFEILYGGGSYKG